MARLLNEDKRMAILQAAALLIASEGLAAPTAQIAKNAGVPHGSIFTYFNNKVELLNAVYAELKRELTDTVTREIVSTAGPREQLDSVWTAWTRWGAANSAKRRALAQLAASDQISDASRAAVYQNAAPVLDVIWRASAGGSLAQAPRAYIGALVEALANTTIDFMDASPDTAESICATGFEALSRVLQ